MVQSVRGFDEGVTRDVLLTKQAGYKLPKLIVATGESLRAPNGKADYAKAKGLAGVA